MFLGLGLVMVLLFVEIFKPKQKPFVPGIRTISQKENRRRPKSKRGGRVKPATRNLLYAMCAGDLGTAHRLASCGVGATEEERWQYAIYRLERDRR